jgi:hypothetical protein
VVESVNIDVDGNIYSYVNGNACSR